MAAPHGPAPGWMARPSAAGAARARAPPPAAAGASKSALVPAAPPAGKAQLQMMTAGLLEDPLEVRSVMFAEVQQCPASHKTLRN